MTPAEAARALSFHHAACPVCQRGGRLAAGPGGVRRVACEAEAELFAALYGEDG